MEFCQSVVDLIEHHHTVTAVSIVLGVVAVEADGSSEVVHGFLIVTDGHEGLPSFRMIFGMGRTFVVVWSRLQAGDGFAEFLNGVFCISFVFFFGVLSKRIPGFVVQLRSEFLFLDLVSMI